jgi:hypothetical protein
MKQVLDSIYLSKRGDLQNTSSWAYYRVRSWGKDGDNIAVCLVQWPSFTDIDVVGEELKAVVENPGDTGFSRAYPNLVGLMQTKWNVDHDASVLIGAIVREV